MTLKLYYDIMSQPSRALYIVMKLSGINFEPVSVALRDGEHLTEEFKETKNRFQRVPFVHDGDFKLAESVAIVRYLSREHGLGDNWYPKDSKQQARVDEYLEWQHHNTRLFCALFFQKKWLIPLMSGKPTRAETLEKVEADMKNTLDFIENTWLGGNKFLTGNRINVSDLFAACEIEQTRIAGFDPREGRPVLSAWLQRVRSSTNPHYDEAHKLVNKLAEMAKKQEVKAKL